MSEPMPAHMTDCPVFERLERRLLLSAGSTGLAAPAIPDLLAAYDTGISACDNFTTRDNSAASKVLAFEVEGVTPGAMVRVYCDGAVIGQVEAAGETVVVETDGETTLSVGEHEITAVQSVADAGGVSESAPSAALDVTIADGSTQFAVVNSSGAIIAMGSVDSFSTLAWNGRICNSDSGSWTTVLVSDMPDANGSIVDSDDLAAWTDSPDTADADTSDVDASDDAPAAQGRGVVRTDGASPLAAPRRAAANGGGRATSPGAGRVTDAPSMVAPSGVFQLTLPAWSDQGVGRQAELDQGRATRFSTGAPVQELCLVDAVAAIASAIPMLPADGGPVQATAAMSADSPSASRMAQGAMDPADGDTRRRRESAMIASDGVSEMWPGGHAYRRGGGIIESYVQDVVVLVILLHGLRQPPATADELTRAVEHMDAAGWVKNSFCGAGVDTIAVARPVSVPLYPGLLGAAPHAV